MKCLLGKWIYDLSKMLCCKHVFWHFPSLYHLSANDTLPTPFLSLLFSVWMSSLLIITKDYAHSLPLSLKHRDYVLSRRQLDSLHMYVFFPSTRGDWGWSCFRNKKIVLHRFPLKLTCVSLDGKFCSINSTAESWGGVQQDKIVPLKVLLI